LLPEAAPGDRHPVQLAEPVYLEGYRARAGEEPGLDFGDGVVLDVAVQRVSPASELRPEHVTRSDALFGLLRFDGGRWAVQPLAVRLAGKKGGAEFTGSGAYAFVRKRRGETLAVLQERASRLLRKKS
jgi:hypothetical protein